MADYLPKPDAVHRLDAGGQPICTTETHTHTHTHRLRDRWMDGYSTTWCSGALSLHLHDNDMSCACGPLRRDAKPQTPIFPCAFLSLHHRPLLLLSKTTAQHSIVPRHDMALPGTPLEHDPRTSCCHWSAILLTHRTRQCNAMYYSSLSIYLLLLHTLLPCTAQHMVPSIHE